MYSLSLLTVDLKIAKERLLNVFEIADSIDSQPRFIELWPTLIKEPRSQGNINGSANLFHFFPSTLTLMPRNPFVEDTTAGISATAQQSRYRKL
jgi:hypothetical protein